MDWVPIFAIASVVFAAGLLYMAIARRRGNPSVVLTPGQVLSGLLGLAVVSFLIGLTIWGIADAWIFGGGVPFEEHYRR